MLDRSLLRYLSSTSDQVRDADGSCRVHLVLHKARVELAMRLVLIVVDLLLAPLDAAQVSLCSRGLGRRAPRFGTARTCSFMPHEAGLGKLVSVGDDVA